ncbi:MAG TPA: hypothetical protein VI999_02485 [Thermoplasmata archaeon]|nr:hypothetical protein [Thermoplasmata archaeon]
MGHLVLRTLAYGAAFGIRVTVGSIALSTVIRFAPVPGGGNARARGALRAAWMDGVTARTRRRRSQ